MTNSVLAKLAVNISANNAEFNKRIAESQKGLTQFTGNITKLAGTLGVAFGIREIASFGLEISKLAGEAEGVRAAFDRLPGSVKLMEDLKQATGGTVSELDLMKRTVQASNFDISLSALPRLLEFATLRAQQTGQSVDYLVDSIVTGIGRKSKLILDNLGISAVQLNEALGGVTTGVASIGEVADAVGKIAESNLQNMAGFSDNASTKLQKLAASWENVKVSIGDAANSTGFLGGSIDALSGSFEILASKNLSFFEKASAFFSGNLAGAALDDFLRKQEKINAEQKKQEQVTREVDRAFKEFNGDIDAYGKAIETHIYKTELLSEFTKRLNTERKVEVETLESLKAQQEELNSLFDQTDVNNAKELTSIGQQIVAINKKREALEKLRKEQAGGKKLGFAPIDANMDDVENPFAGEEERFIKSVKENFADDYENPVPGIVDEISANEELTISLREVADARDEDIEAMKRQQEQAERQQAVMLSLANTIGEAFGEAIAGQKKFADAMKSIVPQLIKMFFAEAMAAIIAAGAKDGAKSGNAIVGVVAATAGAAAISALFGKYGGGGSSNGFSNAPSVSQTPSERYKLDVNVTGKTTGYNMELTESAERYRRSRVG